MNLKRREFLLLGGSLIATAAACTGKSFKPQIIQPTPTASSKEMLLRFVSVADTGTGAKGQYAVAEAMTQYHQQNPYDLVVLAGDNIYTNGEIEKIGEVFERPYAKLLKQNVKFQACLGNHDIRAANGEHQLHYPQFNMQGRNYTYSRDKAQFFVLDTNVNADIKGQLVWLDTELGKSNALWKVVYGHHPIYSSGEYGTNQAFVKIFTPLFQKHKVNLYINGHDHNYERTQAIDGTTYLVCGAGAGQRKVGRSAWTEYSTSDLSFAAVELYPDRMEIKGIDSEHRIFDTGIIRQSA
jgi:3',5'-cyclic AMP phosphodiesterase CpdA